MLTNEQCIEIATKVWLVSLEELEEQYGDDRGELSYYVWDTPEWKSDLSFAEWIDRRVNSWQGFGRTVEAMDRKSWFISIGSTGIFFYTFRGLNKVQTMKRDNGLIMESKWEATHLAALEAINDNQ